MAALDLLGRRWALRILWELRGEALSFRALREAAGDVSPAVLNTRLAELREAGLVESTGAGYATTAAGLELCRALEPLQDWARRWARG
jgi:DNA-binding HxlR family transcriptional regulator